MLYRRLNSFLLTGIFFNTQQVPEEIDRVMVGIEAYLSIRRHTSGTGYSVFEDSEIGEAVMSFFILLLISLLAF